MFKIKTDVYSIKIFQVSSSQLSDLSLRSRVWDRQTDRDQSIALIPRYSWTNEVIIIGY